MIPDDTLVLVRRDSGGVFPDGTTNTQAIDFAAPPTTDDTRPSTYDGPGGTGSMCHACGWGVFAHECPPYASRARHAALVTGVLEAMEFLDKVRPSGYHVENAYAALARGLEGEKA